MIVSFRVGDGVTFHGSPDWRFLLPTSNVRRVAVSDAAVTSRDQATDPSWPLDEYLNNRFVRSTG